MSNIGRSNEWKKGQTAYALDQMLKADPELYDKITETPGFAYWFNVLCILSYQSMWSVEDVQEYLRTGTKDRKKWNNDANRNG